jgi:hypothetical protein
MAERTVTYRRGEQAAGSRTGGVRCLICGQTFWAQPLVWTYTAEGAPLRYAHIHHEGEMSPPEVTATVEAQEGER